MKKQTTRQKSISERRRLARTLKRISLDLFAIKHDVGVLTEAQISIAKVLSSLIAGIRANASLNGGNDKIMDLDDKEKELERVMRKDD